MGLSHNVETGPCVLCESKLKSAHPIFQELWPKLKKQFPLTHCSWAFRNASDQEAMFKLGSSRLHWPNSLHNKSDSKEMPCSRAIDLFAIDEDGKAVWSPYQFKKIYEWMRENKFPIVWGGTWKKFVDSPHYECDASVIQP